MSKNQLTPIGKRIKMESIRRNLTLTEVADLLGMTSIKYLNHIMYGRRTANGKYIKNIAQFININDDEELKNLKKLA